MKRPLEPILVPLLHVWWRLRRGMTLGVRGLVEDPDGRVLLVRHTYVPGWHFPGGGVESDETAETALRRELQEEGGVEVIACRLLGVFANGAAFRNDHVLLYQATEWRPCPAGGAGEIAEHGFFARDNLPGGVTPATRRRLAEIYSGAAASGHW